MVVRAGIHAAAGAHGLEARATAMPVSTVDGRTVQEVTQTGIGRAAAARR
jgi:hypothetical protein